MASAPRACGDSGGPSLNMRASERLVKRPWGSGTVWGGRKKKPLVSLQKCRSEPQRQLDVFGGMGSQDATTCGPGGCPASWGRSGLISRRRGAAMLAWDRNPHPPLEQPIHTTYFTPSGHVRTASPASVACLSLISSTPQSSHSPAILVRVSVDAASIGCFSG